MPSLERMEIYLNGILCNYNQNINALNKSDNNIPYFWMDFALNYLTGTILWYNK